MGGNIFKKIGSARRTRKKAKEEGVEQKQSDTTAPFSEPEDSNAAIHDNEERNDESTGNKESTASPDDEKAAYTGPVSRDGTPIISSKATEGIRPSDVKNYKPEGYKQKRSKTVPTAMDSAFTGPVRYDWVDVESSAAVKIQSVFRRNQVLEQMEDEGKSTAAMRNRKRAQRVKGKKIMPSEDVPTIFRFCGLGFIFGDATGEDPEAYMERKKIEEREKRQQKHDMEVEKRKFKMRNKGGVKVEEAVEVVDDE